MIQEIERFRKTGKRNKRTINTKNILFIMSGAFADLHEIVRKRIKDSGIGFGAQIKKSQVDIDILQHVKSEDLINYGFESEFVGRLPVRAVFENLTESDLFEILNNPNNPIILGKKLDFAAYDIEIKFHDDALRLLARNAFEENTGARGLVSAAERALLPFERRLPSIGLQKFPVTSDIIENPEQSLSRLMAEPRSTEIVRSFEQIAAKEHEFIKTYLEKNKTKLAEKFNFTMTPARMDIVAHYYTRQVMDVGKAIQQIRSYYDEVKKIELYFFKNHDINIVLEDDAVDTIIGKVVHSGTHLDEFYRQLNIDFEHGLKLVRDKTGRSRFFITQAALLHPEDYIRQMLSGESDAKTY
jgi:hypothetical protein